MADNSAYSVEIYNPREGGALKKMAVQQRNGQLMLESPQESANEDWLFLVKKANAATAR
jgi:hypothetical protein